MAIPLLTLIPLAVKTVSSVVGGYFERKNMKTQHKQDMQTRKQEYEIGLAERGQFADIDADKTTISQMDLTWKDEYLTLVFTIPAILVFIPGMDGYVKDGFNALQQTPDWYQILLVLVAASGLGLRKFVNLVLAKIGGEGGKV